MINFNIGVSWDCKIVYVNLQLYSKKRKNATILKYSNVVVNDKNSRDMYNLIKYSIYPDKSLSKLLQ